MSENIKYIYIYINIKIRPPDPFFGVFSPVPRLKQGMASKTQFKQPQRIQKTSPRSSFPKENYMGCIWLFPKMVVPNMVFPTKNDHFGVFWGYHHFRKPPYMSAICTWNLWKSSICWATSTLQNKAQTSNQNKGHQRVPGM